MTGYRTVFSRQALDYIVTVNDEVFSEIDHWVDAIERAPATPGDYTEHDSDGRELQVVVLAQVAITYWPDHASREIRVTRIEPMA